MTSTGSGRKKDGPVMSFLPLPEHHIHTPSPFKGPVDTYLVESYRWGRKDSDK